MLANSIKKHKKKMMYLFGAITVVYLISLFSPWASLDVKFDTYWGVRIHNYNFLGAENIFYNVPETGLLNLVPIFLFVVILFRYVSRFKIVREEGFNQYEKKSVYLTVISVIILMTIVGGLFYNTYNHMGDILSPQFDEDVDTNEDIYSYNIISRNIEYGFYLGLFTLALLLFTLYVQIKTILRYGKHTKE